MTVDGLTRLPPSDRLVDTVYDAIRDAIFAGNVPPGSKLSVPELARTLGVSRSPVREAVLRLTQNGLAREEPRRGAEVARIERQDLISLYEVRASLEGLATRLAATRGGPDLVNDLRTLLDEHRQAVQAGDLVAHQQADISFHRRIRDEAGNPELMQMLEGIQERVRLAMLTTTVTSGPTRALEDHVAIFEAISRGDPAEAEEAARAHIDRLRLSMEQSDDHR